MNEREIFIGALQQGSPAERQAYLDRACGTEDFLRQRVEGLLRDCEKAANFLDSPAPALLATIDDLVTERPGAVVGPYKLLEQVGEGGMGLVFVAEQSRPVRRKVALKVIKPGMDSRQVVARFEAERQALALMDHQNIARVFDGGTTESGRPYFVMELVRGVPITEYCDAHKLDVRRRLALFVQVCGAVQHAHTKGVIHRDLKPGNVLVAHDDTVAVPKVIDFGVAKATSQPLTERTLHTALSQVVGTPLYMSPEQAALHQNDVDTRSDVYALGVLLYELLTGTTPLEAETLRRVGLDEVRRLIREEEPPTPSQRVSTLGAARLATLSGGVDVRRLPQQLRAELDWVVMRCLEKDRDRRYQSASALAADVQRYLDDEPVEACPPSAAYRLRRFARRNWRALATAGIVALALVTATVVSTWQAVRATNAERRAATEAAIAQAVNDFLQEDLLGHAAGVPRLGNEFGGNADLTVREAVDRAAEKIGDRFHDEPVVEAAIRTAIGDAYKSLSRHSYAVPHLEQAVALRQVHLGPNHSDTLKSMLSLSRACSWAGRHPEAIALCQQLLETRKAMLGPDHPMTLACENDLAQAYIKAGDWNTSGRLLEHLLEQQRAACGPTHPSTLGTMHLLAMNHCHAGRLAESMALHEKVVELLRATNGPEHESTLWPMLTFAQVCQRAGQYDRAEKLLREALQHYRKLEDSQGRRNRIANALGWLALNELLQQRYEAAEKFARDAVALKQYEPHRRHYWSTLWGAALVGQQKYAEAEPLLLQGYEGLKQLQPVLLAEERCRLDEAGERVVHFYEVTRQPEKARAWREKLAPMRGPDRNP